LKANAELPVRIGFPWKPRTEFVARLQLDARLWPSVGDPQIGFFLSGESASVQWEIQLKQREGKFEVHDQPDEEEMWVPLALTTKGIFSKLATGRGEPSDPSAISAPANADGPSDPSVIPAPANAGGASDPNVSPEPAKVYVPRYVSFDGQIPGPCFGVPSLHSLDRGGISHGRAVKDLVKFSVFARHKLDIQQRQQSNVHNDYDCLVRAFSPGQISVHVHDTLQQMKPSKALLTVNPHFYGTYSLFPVHPERALRGNTTIVDQITELARLRNDGM
jgi:hypothetical protein